MNKMWQMWAKAVPSEMLSYVEQLIPLIPPISGEIGGDNHNIDISYRKCDVRWIDGLQHPNLYHMLWWYIKRSNKESFGFNISTIDEIQISTYKDTDNGKYDWHHDTSWVTPTMYDRKITMVVQLSDSDDYDGGDLEFDGIQPLPPKEILRSKGTIIAFPSPLRHRVTPVVRGTRHSLICWAEGPKFV